MGSWDTELSCCGVPIRQNEGLLDRLLRVGLGLVLIPGGLLAIPTPWGIILGAVGLISLFTGLTGFCLLYAVLGISTKG